MTSTRNRNLTTALVVVLAVWPVLHHALVQGYGIHPWRFFGLAMYATPMPQLRLADLRAARAGEALRDVPLGIVPVQHRSDVVLALQHLISCRSTWGRLCEPELDASLTELFPSADRVEIGIEESSLDHNATVRGRRLIYTCRADAQRSFRCSRAWEGEWQSGTPNGTRPAGVLAP